jgi:hypothetical protein
MSKTAIQIQRDTRAVVIYQDTDEHGRQVLIARNGHGKLLYQCRRIRALASFLKGKAYNFYEYASLPRSAREALDNMRAEHDRKRRERGPSHPTLADVWPS